MSEFEKPRFELSQDKEGNPIEVFHNAHALPQQTVEELFRVQFENIQYQPIEIILKRQENQGGPIVLKPGIMYELSQSDTEKQENFFAQLAQDLPTVDKMIITHNPISIFKAQKTYTSSGATSS